MQNNDMVEKKKVLWDGVEIPGLIKVGEITQEKRTVEVPSFKRIRDVQSDITKLPQLTFVYKIERATDTLEFFEAFFEQNQVKDCEIIRTDAHGDEFQRKVYPECEIFSMAEPEYDAGNPSFAQITIIVIPYNILKV